MEQTAADILARVAARKASVPTNEPPPEQPISRTDPAWFTSRLTTTMAPPAAPVTVTPVHRHPTARRQPHAPVQTAVRLPPRILDAGVVVIAPWFSSIGETDTAIHRTLEDPRTVLGGMVLLVGSSGFAWSADSGSPGPSPTGDLVPISGTACPDALEAALKEPGRFVSANSDIAEWAYARRGWPAPRCWSDIIHQAACLNLPRDLTALVAKIGGVPLDTARAALTRSGPFPATPVAALQQARAVSLLDGALTGYAEIDDAGRAMHRVINRRGARLDIALVRATAALTDPMAGAIERRITTVSGGAISVTAVRDDAAYRLALGTLGMPVTGTSVGVLRHTLSLATDPLVKLLIGGRLFFKTAAPASITKGLGRVCADGRLRDLYDYHAQHPGRWSSRGLCVHSLRKPSMKVDRLKRVIAALLDDDLDAVIDAAGPEHLHECLACVSRAVFTPEDSNIFLIGDLAQVELRILLYLAGDTEALALFDTCDMHLRMAEGIFRTPIAKDDPLYEVRRGIGKVTNHGSGFGLSADGFQKKCDEEWFVDLSALGITAKQVIEAYHSQYPYVRRTHRRHQYAAVQALTTGKSVKAGPIEWSPCTFGLMAIMPSGRPMIFHEAKAVPGKFDPKELQIEYTKYDVNGRAKRWSAWGGRLIQNICEAIERDLIVERMVACEQAGLPVVLHSHDELVAEVPRSRLADAKALFSSIMAAPPPWAKGALPITADVHESLRYTKKSLL